MFLNSRLGRPARTIATLVAATAVLVGVVLVAPPVRAQSSGDAPEGFRSFALHVGQRTVTCSSAGVPVVWIASHGLNDVGMTIPVGQWTVIKYNPIVLNGMSDRLKLFWLGHECGHAYLRTMNESRADCWSATTGVRQGWFDESDVDDLADEMKDNPGDSVHPPGPARVANVRRCVAAAANN